MRISLINTEVTYQKNSTNFCVELNSNHEIKELLFELDPSLVETFDNASIMQHVLLTLSGLRWIRCKVFNYWMLEKKHPIESIFAIRRFDLFNMYRLMRKSCYESQGLTTMFIKLLLE